ncbi:hypothetical protein D3C87_2136640 [compost metagenome]
MLGPRDAGRDVGEDHVVPAVDGDQAIERGQVDTGLPLGLADLILERRRDLRSTVGHGGSSISYRC